MFVHIIWFIFVEQIFKHTLRIFALNHSLKLSHKQLSRIKIKSNQIILKKLCLHCIPNQTRSKLLWWQILFKKKKNQSNSDWDWLGQFDDNYRSLQNAICHFHSMKNDFSLKIKIKIKMKLANEEMLANDNRAEQLHAIEMNM